GMVAHGGGAAINVDLGLHLGADVQRACAQDAMMTEYIRLNFLSVFYCEYRVAADDLAAVAHLAAGLGVERRVIKNNNTVVTLIHLLYRAAIDIQRNDGSFFHQKLLIAAEGSGRAGVLQ